MKIEQCQKLISKPIRLAERREGNRSWHESDSCHVKKIFEVELKSKNTPLAELHNSEQSIVNNIIKEDINHFGDADTYFRKTLRSYGNFDFWRKCHLNFNISNSKTKYPNTIKRNRKAERIPSKSIDLEEIQLPFEVEMPVHSEEMFEVDTAESDTTVGEDDEDLKEVDEIIAQASKELEQVAEENQQLMELLEKPSKNLEDENSEIDNNVIKHLEDAEQEAKEAANNIYELKTRVGELLRKEELTEDETSELNVKNRELKEQMKLFEEKTKKIQYLIEKTNINAQMGDGKNEGNYLHKQQTETSPTKTVGESVRTGYCSCCSENLRKIPSVPSFAKKLSQSYSMQEKLAAENADLESVRFKLQEELLNKDQSLECLQRELGNLQNEMRVLARENVTLNEKLSKIQQQGSKENVNKQKKTFFKASKKLQEYSDNTYELEKQLIEMENDVKCLHEEICSVQREREHLEKHRKMMVMPKICQAPQVVPTFNVSTPKHTAYTNSLNKGIPTHLIKELFDQYDKLENDLKLKINGVLTLKNDYENLKKLTKEAEEYKKTTQEKVKECEKIMNKIKTENDLPVEQEKQILAAKERLKKAQDTLKEEQKIIKDQKKLVEDITAKFIEAQQQIEEQRRNLDVKFESQDYGLNLGSQIVTSLHDKLEEISI